MTQEKQIEQWIQQHRDELVKDIAALVQIRSVSDYQPNQREVYGSGCARVLDTMLAIGERYGFETKNADYYCGTISYGTGERSIGLWGHLDVVPEGDGWVYEPYACTEKDGYLIGRGVQDNKGACMTGLYAIRCLRDLEIPLSCRLMQISGCAEETGMTDVAYYAAHYPLPDRNLVTDCGFPVCYGEKGILEGSVRAEKPFCGPVVALGGGLVSNSVPASAWIRLTCTGEVEAGLSALPEEIKVTREAETLLLEAKGMAKHAAAPEGSVNAIGKLCAAVLAAGLVSGEDGELLSFFAQICGSYDGSAFDAACADEVSGAMTCVGGVIGMVDGHAELKLNIRYPIFADSTALIEKLQNRCAERGCTLTRLSDSKPNYQDKESAFVKALTETYRRVTGDEAEPFVMGGGTYARKLPNAVTYGPSLPTDLSPLGLPVGHGDCHSPDEALLIDNLLLALKIYVLALIELDETLAAG